ncbi:ribonuclease domain-containing protein [Streptomyces yerevanensis]|uniref:ribonuclease domain-containing protein n=1 Tax=Streptomyces yerevanensis TaxID=66378 RepID=UPI00068FBA89|nr:ribonuclease domain-containing protein [Streptomyces yerevanensis]
MPTPDLTAASEPAALAGSAHRHRPQPSRRFTAKFLVLFLAVATLLGGFTALGPQSQGTATAAVDDGKNFGGFPTKLDEMTAFWTAKGWPSDKKASRETNPSDGITGFIYRGGAYGDRDGQLTAYIRANYPNAVAPSFTEYDIDFRPTRNTRRNAERIVRDNANGFVFYTNDHYANFHLYAYVGLPGADDAAGAIPPTGTTVDDNLAPVAEETEGDPQPGGSGGNQPDPNTFLPAEDPAFEAQYNETMGQADERGDAMYANLNAINNDNDGIVSRLVAFLLYFVGSNHADLPDLFHDHHTEL